MGRRQVNAFGFLFQRLVVRYRLGYPARLRLRVTGACRDAHHLGLNGLAVRQDARRQSQVMILTLASLVSADEVGRGRAQQA